MPLKMWKNFDLSLSRGETLVTSGSRPAWTTATQTRFWLAYRHPSHHTVVYIQYMCIQSKYRVLSLSSSWLFKVYKGKGVGITESDHTWKYLCFTFSPVFRWFSPTREDFYPRFLSPYPSPICSFLVRFSLFTIAFSLFSSTPHSKQL